jgi:hypothetical protein
MKKVLILFCTYLSFNLYSQGCSDAGFCSLVNTTPLSNSFDKKQKINLVRLGFSYGRADNSVNAYNTSFEFTRYVNSKLAISTKINFLAHAGNSIQTVEIGDVYFTGDYNINSKLKATAGFKIPLHLGNKEKKGIILPMDYQPTLGTLDLLVGLQHSINNLTIGSGIQIPLTQNDNKFITNNFVVEEDFYTTNGYRRNSDLWFRLAYTFKFKNLTLIPNLLPIIHLGNDSYINSLGARTAIMGSSGTTFNAGVQVDYKLCENTIIGLNGALPFVTRTARPDGLARKYVLTLDYRVNF